MSRNTIFGSEPEKCLRGDDMPAKPRRATHLVTYPNFLTDNTDHSQDRPCAGPLSPDKKRPTQQSRDMYRGMGPSNDFSDVPAKKKYEMSRQLYMSSYDLSHSSAPGPQSKADIQRRPEKQSSSLNTAGQPKLDSEVRACIRTNPSRYDSGSMRRTFTYL